MTAPCVSVIVPVYSVQDYVSRTLGSALHQTLTDIGIIVIDDGSDDEPAGICNACAQRHPERMQVFHQEHARVSAARSRGMEMAGGTCLTFPGGDDCPDDNFCEVLYGAAVAGQADISKGGMVLKAPDGHTDRRGGREHPYCRSWVHELMQQQCPCPSRLSARVTAQLYA